jgi:plasmid stability protein
MGTLTIRGFEDELYERLRRRAAGNGRSMEEEVRVMLADHLNQDHRASSRSLYDLSLDFRRSTGGVELELPQRPPTQIIDFSEHA